MGQLHGLFIVIGTFIAALLLILYLDQRQWEQFKREHKCKAMMTRGDKVAYQCEFGVTIWR